MDPDDEADGVESDAGGGRRNDDGQDNARSDRAGNGVQGIHGSLLPGFFHCWNRREFE